ncbi:MAG: sporulation protein YunB [Butyricicoccus pullicaecorum]
MGARRNYRRMGRAYLLALIPLVCAVAYTLFLHAIRPILFDHAENYVVHEASFALYDVLTDTVYENRAEYANLVQFERDSEQNVTALKTDGILANHLKVQVSQAVYEALDELEHSKVQISLGSLLGPDLFGGFGPDFQVGISSLGYVQADFISAFTDAGINQTRHQIILEVTAEMRILTGLGGVDTEVTNQLVVSDTVIVGHVPEQYTYIDDTEQSLLGKINDYTP